jgi:phosphoglycolate phosphatase-like HAD superfamily hydrolase
MTRKQLTNARNDPPREDAFGFWGTVQTNSFQEATGRRAIDEQAAERLWEVAMQLVVELFDADAETAVNFLRSRYGRHLADEATNFAGSATDEGKLMLGIEKALKRCGRRGYSIWGMHVNAVRNAMRRGEWQD